MIKNDRIETYNALKGIGALGILFSHMAYLSESDNLFWKGFYDIFMGKGAVCCTLFVLCSGFFLNYAWKDYKFGQYIVKKLKRIYPLTIIVFVMALIIDVIFSGNEIVSQGVVTGSAAWYFNAVANIFLFKAFVPFETTFYSFHGPSWYISVLFAFFLIAYPFVKGLHGKHKEKWARIIWICCIAAYIVELIVCILVEIKNWNGLWLCYVNPWFRIFGEGFAGILLCEKMDSLQSRIKHINFAELLASTLFIVGFLIRNIDISICDAWIQIIPMGCMLIAFRRGEGIISKSLKSKGMQFIGDVSFELYMTHAFVYEGLPIAVGFVSKSIAKALVMHAGIRFLITLLLSIIVAKVVHIFIKRLDGWILFQN